MTLFAHSGHWLVSVSYLAPLIFLVIVIGVGKVRDRRAGLINPPGHGAPPSEDKP